VSERIGIGDDVSLAYEDTGGADPRVVFVHGLGGSAEIWEAQLRACEKRGFRGTAYDQRGAGSSPRPDGPYTVELWVEDLIALLDALEVERTALVGNSVGCMVVERATVALGNRVWALVMIGGALEWRPEAGPVFAQRVQLARAGRMGEIAEAVALTGLSERCRREQPELHGRFKDLIASNDPAAYAHASLATSQATMVDPAAVACPALACCGSEDPVTPPQAADRIAAAMPRGNSAVIDGAAHWCMLEAPERTNEVVFGFLEGIGP
jgi:3-oxoadipate enol-lactonase